MIWRRGGPAARVLHVLDEIDEWMFIDEVARAARMRHGRARRTLVELELAGRVQAKWKWDANKDRRLAYRRAVTPLRAL